MTGLVVLSDEITEAPELKIGGGGSVTMMS